MNTHSILIFGNARRLLETRQLVLKQAGFNVAVALSLETLMELLVKTSFDLLLLCHSLSSTECETASVQGHVLRPSMKHLILCKALSVRSRNDRDFYLDGFVGPVDLIATANELTGHVDPQLRREKLEADEALRKTGKRTQPL